MLLKPRKGVPTDFGLTEQGVIRPEMSQAMISIARTRGSLHQATPIPTSWANSTTYEVTRLRSHNSPMERNAPKDAIVPASGTGVVHRKLSS